MFPSPNPNHDDNEMLNNPGMYSGHLSEEEIDVMNAPGEGEEQYQRHVYMVGDEGQEVYEEEEDLQYEYLDDEFEPVDVDPNQQFGDGILENREMYDSHYLNVDPEYLAEKQEDFMFNNLENSTNISRISKERRLAMYPEMQMLPPLSRNRGKKSEDVPLLSAKLEAKFSPAAAALLKASRLESTSQGSSSGEPPVLSARLMKLKGLNALIQETTKIKKDPKPPTRKFVKPPPFDKNDTKTNFPTLPLTPLPDRFYQRRVTITAEQSGFFSDCCECRICHFMFRNPTLLASHMKKHDISGQDEVTKTGLVCPITQGCNNRADSIATIIKHLKLAHGVSDIPFERVVFKNIGEFKLWRSELERLTMSSYSRVSGKKNIFSKSTYYQCHHSGSLPARDASREKKGERHRPSKKLGKTCTAFFHIRENDDGTVLLRGCVKHTGHGVSVRDLPLSEEIKLEIASYLIKGYDESDIVDIMRRKTTPKDRKYYIQNYEIRNVASKIERYKEEYKRKVENGEPLPDLQQVSKASFARQQNQSASQNQSQHPNQSMNQRMRMEEEEYDDGEYYETKPETSSQHFGNIVVEKGHFNVPTTPRGKNVPGTSTAPQKEDEDQQPTRHSSRLMTKKARPYSKWGDGVEDDYQDQGSF